MAYTYIDQLRTTGVIGSLELDVTFNYGHNFSNDVTQYPVEDGSTFSDHIRQQPERLQISGFVTNTGIRGTTDQLDQLIRINPITREFEGVNYAAINPEDPEARVYTAFRELMNIAGYRLNEGGRGSELISVKEPKLVDIITGLTVYTNMAMTTLSIPRNRQYNDALYFDAEFVKVQIVDSEQTKITSDKVADVGGRAPRIEQQAPSTNDVGTQTPKQVESSLLYNWTIRP